MENKKEKVERKMGKRMAFRLSTNLYDRITMRNAHHSLSEYIRDALRKSLL